MFVSFLEKLSWYEGWPTKIRQIFAKNVKPSSELLGQGNQEKCENFAVVIACFKWLQAATIMYGYYYKSKFKTFVKLSLLVGTLFILFKCRSRM